jgi:TonB family protein
MLVLSVAVHVIVMIAFSLPARQSAKKLTSLGSFYSVNLVGSAGSLPGDGQGGQPEARKAPPAPSVPDKKPAPVRVKPQPTRKEADAVSLSKKKAPEKAATPTKQELARLDERLRDMRKKTEPIAVPGSRTGGGPGTGGSSMSGSSTGGRALNPLEERYIRDVWEKIRNAWALPGLASFKKDLETIVTIRIRKDGRIVDVNVEKRSGNRVYDESILRVLRGVDPLPSIPDSLNTDVLEIGFRFLPGDLG